MINDIDWSKDITFEAANPNFKVRAINCGNSYKISTPHFSFSVDNNGEPLNKNLGSSYRVKNSKETDSV